MDLTCNSQVLNQELLLLNKIVPTKPVQPALSHILFEAETMSPKVSLSATDFEVSLSTSCPATVTAPGRILLPASKLLEMVNQLPNADVRLTLDKAHTRVTCGSFTSRLQSLDPMNFPTLPTVDGTVAQMSGASLRILIKRTKQAIPDKTQKYVINGALLMLTPTVVALIAIDGKRMAFATAARPEAPQDSFIIPSKTLDLLLTHPLDGLLSISHTNQHLFFQLGERLLSSRMLEGKFPKYDSIIPRDHDKSATIPRTPFAAALKRVGLIADQQQATYFTLSPGSLLIEAASAELGDAQETLPIDYTADTIKVYTSWQHVLDFLEVATNPTITLSVSATSPAMLLTDGEDFFTVVMLMRP